MRLHTLAATFAFALSSSSGVQSVPATQTTPRPLDKIDFVEPVEGPFAYTHFCVRYAAECKVQGPRDDGSRPVAFTKSHEMDLIRINQSVNADIAPVQHVNDTSFDTWRIDPQRGDCNDYAVSKRHKLMERGWPSDDLLLSEVSLDDGEHHLILLVRTDHGNFVLDNLFGNPRPWNEVHYSWIRIQLPSQPAMWSKIRDPSLTSRS